MKLKYLNCYNLWKFHSVAFRYFDTRANLTRSPGQDKAMILYNFSIKLPYSSVWSDINLLASSYSATYRQNKNIKIHYLLQRRRRRRGNKCDQTMDYCPLDPFIHNSHQAAAAARRTIDRGVTRISHCGSIFSKRRTCLRVLSEMDERPSRCEEGDVCYMSGCDKLIPPIIDDVQSIRYLVSIISSGNSR